MTVKPLSLGATISLSSLSFLLVAFGQPAWSSWAGLVASCCGFAFFFRTLLDIPKKSRRFWLGTAWFAGVQIVQFSWTFSHPFLYIYAVLLFCASTMGMQFGILAIFVQRKLFYHPVRLLFVAAFWTLM